MKILVIGSGGREHAIVWKIRKDNPDAGLFAVPGNGGICDDAECLQGNANSPEQTAGIVLDKKIDLTVVGPEVPLAAGISDVFRQKGMKVFGPVKKGAMLESSKCFAKDFMKRNKIPTADFTVSYSFEECMKILGNRKFPCVIKFDGLAAGKGVQVSMDMEEARDFVTGIYKDKIFGAENQKVVIEDCLSGTEMSYLAFTDTKTFLPMVPAKDHKRVFDGDRGPNTGGMGCYSPSDTFNSGMEKTIREDIVLPTLKGLQKENIDYRGVLYFGIMLTEKGPRLLEYNVRFGDPETQVILPRMESSLTDIMEAVIEGSLEKADVRWSEKKSVCVILASGGYPGEYKTGIEIKGLAEIKDTDVTIFHAGTKKENGRVVTAGGRVLGITSLGDDIEKAAGNAYRAAEKIEFEGKHYRKDICPGRKD
ncbi:MAG: phosphoribosylamine--glycine ligase [Candidatus Omnitrophica bacterium]|nr:phosphoribosylamine--glycine ligase [Candidatus Omnitrophota bacterium]